MSGLMMFNPAGAFQQGFDNGQEKKRAAGLASLMGDYAAGGQPDYRGIAANGGNPLAVRNDAQGQDDRKREQLGQFASLLAKAPVNMRPGIYKQMYPQLSQIVPDAPADYTPEIDQMTMQIAQLYGKGGADPFKPMNVSPGGQVVDPVTGRVIHSNENFAPQRPTWDSDRGAWVLPPGGQYPQQPQQAPPQAPQPTMTDAGGPESFGPMTRGQAMSKVQQMEADRGSPFSVPERLRMVQQMTTTGQFNTDPQASMGGGGNAPQAGGPGFVQVLPPKAKPLSAIQEKIALAREMKATPEQIKNMVLGGEEGGGIDVKNEMSLRKEYGDLIKEPLIVRNSYNKVRSAAANDSAAGDLSMIFAYMKMLDPNSVVRETEFANAQNAAGIPDRVRNVYNKAITGERLGAAQRADFQRQAELLAGQAQEQIDGYKQYYGGLAKDYGFEPDRVAFDPFKPGGNAPKPTPAGAPKAGAVENGYRFKGGNPADPNAWEKL